MEKAGTMPDSIGDLIETWRQLQASPNLNPAAQSAVRLILDDLEAVLKAPRPVCELKSSAWCYTHRRHAGECLTEITLKMATEAR